MAQQFTLPRQVKINVAGRPYAGAQAFFYQTGTETPQAVYQDAELTVPHAPIVLADDDGYFPVIWLDPSAEFKYRVRILSATGALLDDIPDINNKVMTSAEIGTTLESLARTQSEISNGITPVNYAYPPGDVRRYFTSVAEQSRSWYSYGHVATYTSGTTFTIPGNFTGIYKPFARLLVVGNSGTRNVVRTISSTFAAGVTTVTIIADSGGALPNPIRAVSVQVVLDAAETTGTTYDADSFNGGFIVANRNNGTSAVSRVTVSALNTSGASNCAVVLVAVPSTYTATASYLTDGFITPPYAVLYSQVGCPLDIGTSDTSRIGIPADGSAIVIKTDLTVNAGNGATNRSNIVVNGLVDARLAFNSNSAEKAFMFASATEVTLGTNASIPFSLVTGGTRRLTMPAGGLSDYADDAAASAGGVPVGSMYRTGSSLKVRVA